MKEEKTLVKTPFKRNQTVYVVFSDEVFSGEFISRGQQWNYILKENGDVQGFSDAVVYSNEVKAFKELVNILKNKIVAKKE